MDKKYQKHIDITPEMNAQWEAQYGKRRIFDIEIEVETDEVYKFVLRKPDRSVLEAIGRHGVKKDIAAVNKVLIKNCVLGGDMEGLEKDGEVYLEVLERLNLLKKKAKSTIKKR